MKRTFLYLLFLAVSGMATAQTLSVDDVEVLPGGTASYVLKVNVGDGAYTGFQYQMAFPAEGFSLTGNTTVLPSWQGGLLSVGDLDTEGKANASAFSSADKEIPAGDIVVGSVEFSVDGSVAEGDYYVTLSGFDFLDGTNYVHANGGSDVTFKVTVSNRITLDEESATAPEAASGVDVRVKRRISANQWSTICLPFAMSEAQVKTAFGDDVKLGDFKGYETTPDDDENIVGITVKFNEATSIEANHPYIIMVSTPITEFTADGVDIDPEDEPTVAAVKRTKKQWSEMIGTYVNGTIEMENCLFLSGGKFWYYTGDKAMKGYRAYFDFFDVLTAVEESAAPLQIVFDEETTGVENIRVTMADGKYYNLNGQRVEHPRKGLYIMNNKKVVVR